MSQPSSPFSLNSPTPTSPFRARSASTPSSEPPSPVVATANKTRLVIVPTTSAATNRRPDSTMPSSGHDAPQSTVPAPAGSSNRTLPSSTPSPASSSGPAVTPTSASPLVSTPPISADQMYRTVIHFPLTTTAPNGTSSTKTIAIAVTYKGQPPTAELKAYFLDLYTVIYNNAADTAKPILTSKAFDVVEDGQNCVVRSNTNTEITRFTSDKLPERNNTQYSDKGYTFKNCSYTHDFERQSWAAQAKASQRALSSSTQTPNNSGERPAGSSPAAQNIGATGKGTASKKTNAIGNPHQRKRKVKRKLTIETSRTPPTGTNRAVAGRSPSLSQLDASDAPDGSSASASPSHLRPPVLQTPPTHVPITPSSMSEHGLPPTPPPRPSPALAALASATTASSNASASPQPRPIAHPSPIPQPSASTAPTSSNPSAVANPPAPILPPAKRGFFDMFKSSGTIAAEEAAKAHVARIVDSAAPLKNSENNCYLNSFLQSRVLREDRLVQLQKDLENSVAGEFGKPRLEHKLKTANEYDRNLALSAELQGRIAVSSNISNSNAATKADFIEQIEANGYKANKDSTPLDLKNQLEEIIVEKQTEKLLLDHKIANSVRPDYTVESVVRELEEAATKTRLTNRLYEILLDTRNDPNPSKTLFQFLTQINPRFIMGNRPAIGADVDATYEGDQGDVSEVFETMMDFIYNEISSPYRVEYTVNGGRAVGNSYTVVVPRGSANIKFTDIYDAQFAKFSEQIVVNLGRLTTENGIRNAAKFTGNVSNIPFLDFNPDEEFLIAHPEFRDRELEAIVCHSSDVPNGGHYFVLEKREGVWLRLDDLHGNQALSEDAAINLARKNAVQLHYKKKPAA